MFYLNFIIMTEKINVAEILKSKPVGTMLYDKARNISVYLEGVAKATECNLSISCTYDTDRVKKLHYSYKGTPPFFKDGMVILSPSQKMCDWEKFAWKKGDLLICYEGMKPHYTIFDGFENNTYQTFKGKFSYDCYEDKWYQNEGNLSTSTFCKLSRADSKIYVTRGEGHFGGKLNCDTLEIEKRQPEFKDGDILYGEKDIEYSPVVFILKTVKEKVSYYVCLILNAYMSCYYNHQGCVSNTTLRYATDEERRQLFNALAREGKSWDAKKKAVVDLKSEVKLKPFDRVLVRNDKEDQWSANIFSYQVRDMYHCLGEDYWRYCIPYIGNESLLGTTKDVEG